LHFFSVVLIALLVTCAGGCGKSREELEQEKVARQATMEKALAASLAEERDKDRRMREAASEQANERLARDAAEHERELALARIAPPPTRSQPTQEQKDAERAELLRRFTDKLRQSTADPGAMQLRWGELNPKANAMCAEFSAKTKAGGFTTWKRAVVTDLRVAVEEPPTRETMNQYLLFQIAARDTGCFPDVEAVKILQ